MDELLDGAGRDAAAAPEDAGRAVDGLAFQRTGQEGAVPELTADRNFGDDRRAAAVLDHPLDRLDIIKLAHAPDRDPVCREKGVSGAAGGDVAVEGDERLAARAGSPGTRSAVRYL